MVIFRTISCAGLFFSVVAISLNGSYVEQAARLIAEKKIVLIDEASHVSPIEIRDRFPGKTITVCDFYLEGAESGDAISGGYRINGITNIDHHAPTDRMAREVTSTALAVEYVRAYGIVPDNSVVVINHTDCDSMLSALIMTGVLPPEDRFVAAARAADHTGEANRIADLLQVLQVRRDISYSMRNLELFLSGDPLEDSAAEYLAQRLEDRACVRSIPAITDGFVTYLVLPRKIDAGLFAAQFPEAVVIMGISFMPDSPSRLYITLRRGCKAPEKLYLNRLALGSEFGGRWNGIANRRGGGSSGPYQAIVARVNQEIQRFMDGR